MFVSPYVGYGYECLCRHMHALHICTHTWQVHGFFRTSGRDLLIYMHIRTWHTHMHFILYYIYTHIYCIHAYMKSIYMHKLVWKVSFVQEGLLHLRPSGLGAFETDPGPYRTLIL